MYNSQELAAIKASGGKVLEDGTVEYGYGVHFVESTETGILLKGEVLQFWVGDITPASSFVDLTVSTVHDTTLLLDRRLPDRTLDSTAELRIKLRKARKYFKSCLEDLECLLASVEKVKDASK